MSEALNEPDEPEAAPAAEPAPARPRPFADLGRRVTAEAGRVLVGLEREIELCLTAVLAAGHVLLEGPPGVAKTLLARTLAVALGGDFSRIQFTPDLMPADVTGTSVFHPGDGEFRFRPGPIFGHLILCDEINRAPAKTQSALLEAMQESSVTVDGRRHDMPAPFVVLATMNPIEHEGTYPLPEAQLDRFLFKVVVDYPLAEVEERLLREAHPRAPGATPSELGVTAVTSPAELLDARAAVDRIEVREDLPGYVVRLCGETRRSPSLAWGASPRAGVMMLRAAKARALLDGRDYTTRDDIKEVFVPDPAPPRGAGPGRGDRGRPPRDRPRAHPRPGGGPALIPTRRFVWLFGLAVLTSSLGLWFGALNPWVWWVDAALALALALDFFATPSAPGSGSSGGCPSAWGSPRWFERILVVDVPGGEGRRVEVDESFPPLFHVEARTVDGQRVPPRPETPAEGPTWASSRFVAASSSPARTARRCAGPSSSGTFASASAGGGGWSSARFASRAPSGSPSSPRSRTCATRCDSPPATAGRTWACASCAGAGARPSSSPCAATFPATTCGASTGRRSRVGASRWCASTRSNAGRSWSCSSTAAGACVSRPRAASGAAGASWTGRSTPRSSWRRSRSPRGTASARPRSTAAWRRTWPRRAPRASSGGLSRALFAMQPSPHDSDLSRALRELAARHRRRATVIVISDVADPYSVPLQRRALAQASQRHRLIFAALDDPGLRAAAENVGVSSAVRAAAFQLNEDRGLALRKLRTSGARVLDALPADAAAPMLAGVARRASTELARGLRHALAPLRAGSRRRAGAPSPRRSRASQRAARAG